MTKLFYLSVLFFLASCFEIPTPATEEQKKQAMDKASFDPAIISGIGRYEDFKNFLQSNADTIISYRNSRNYVIKVHTGGKDDTVLQKQDCYGFFEGNSNYDNSNIPAFLKPKFDSIYKAIGVSNITSFEVCKDRKIQIDIRTEGEENGLYISHNLLWNAEMKRDYTYSDNKDTLIGNWVYRIGMTEYHGH